MAYNLNNNQKISDNSSERMSVQEATDMMREFVKECANACQSLGFAAGKFSQPTQMTSSKQGFFAGVEGREQEMEQQQQEQDVNQSAAPTAG